MMRGTVKLAAALALPLVLGGCVSASEYAAKNAGFSSVEAKTAEATGKQTVWVQNQQQAQVVSDRVKTLMAKKAIDVETAVQVALLNNKGLQAAYADLGDSAADAWQSTMLVNPTVSVGLTGIGTPGLDSIQVGRRHDRQQHSRACHARPEHCHRRHRIPKGPIGCGAAHAPACLGHAARLDQCGCRLGNGGPAQPGAGGSRRSVRACPGAWQERRTHERGSSPRACFLLPNWRDRRQRRGWRRGSPRKS